MNTQLTEIDKQIKNVMIQIADAASKADLASVQRLTRKASELQEVKEQTVALQQRFDRLTDKRENSALEFQKSNGYIRQLPIEVTDGMIRQNLLTLSPQVKSNKVKVGEEFLIEVFPSGDRFQTTLLEQGKKLRARSEIASFYRSAKVKGGDYVLLTEITPGHWILKKAPDSEYGIARLLRDL
jgi:hypothetical protein